ncbi:MAG: hypothetical protein OQK32_01805 [Gammaproteobacteria bacterium]|nr:hypothetical protein [Gammaproteobacteria bacterium]
MANKEDNLIKFTKRDASEKGRRGGIASAKKKKLNKTFQELAQIMLNSKIKDKKTIEKIKKMCPAIDIKDITTRSALLLSQVEKAIDTKDSKAFEVVRDTSGEKPIDRIEENSNMSITINWGK